MEPAASKPQKEETAFKSPEIGFGPILDQDVKVRYAITIGKEPEEIFNFFRDLKNLPLFMKDLNQIEVLSNKRSHWVIRTKVGVRATWEAEIVEEVPGQLITWNSLEGSQIETSGSIRFEHAPEDLGTILRVAMDYSVPGGKLTEWALLLTTETPEFLMMTNLKRLKALLETGEVPTIEGQTSGREEDGKNLKH